MQTPKPEVQIQERSVEDRRPIPPDPREHWEPAMHPAAARRQPRQRHRPWYWMMIGVVLAVALLGGLATVALVVSTRTSSTHTLTLPSQSFVVGDQPTLILNNQSGDVQIVSGPDHQITLGGTGRLSTGITDHVSLHAQQSGATITVTGEEETSQNIRSGSFIEDLQITVTVPRQTNLAVTNDSGSITSEGVQGQMTLTTHSGSITTTGGSGQITLQTDSGDIHASNISGQMTLTTRNGSITATTASASGASLFQSDSGDIHFSGALAETRSDHFEARIGSITLTLSNATAFEVQAATHLGTIHSEFVGVTILPGDVNGATAVGRVGTGASFAHVTIQTGSGDISLHRA